MKIKVRLRQKPISGNRQSLFLDIYPPIPHPETGQVTRKRYLELFIFGSIDSNSNPIKLDAKINKKLKPLEQIHDANIFSRAFQILLKVEKEANQNENLTRIEIETIAKDKKEQAAQKEFEQRDFLAYFKSLAKERKASSYQNWKSTYSHLEKFSKGSLKFADVTEAFCNDFKGYLLKTKKNQGNQSLSNNSSLSYFNKFKTALKQAYKVGYLKTDINAKIDNIKEVATFINYASIEQLNTLIVTDCHNPILKQAALFSSLTGMRFCNMAKMTWNEIEYVKDEGYSVCFIDKKGKKKDRLPISNDAYSLLGERKQPTDRVFNMKYSAYGNIHLKAWIVKAGITKKITFHCFRHTFATLQLAAGTDIYTVSKLLGHSNLKTTQIYAKVLDATRRAATNKIKLNLKNSE